MTTSITPRGTTPSAATIPSVAPLALRCTECGEAHAPAPQHICSTCLGPLEPVYDERRALPSKAALAARPRSLWRYREWLPFAGETVHSQQSGWTPLFEAPALARHLGVASVWIKHEGIGFPSLSFKDRVVATAINAAHAFGLEVLACASTGNLANAVAAHAARAGYPAWIFIPEDLEPAKIVATSVCGPTLVRVRGTYDDVNRLCAQIADRFGWGFANINLRAYYGEGSKTMAYEIVEQLEWRLPTAVVAPMAGGSLVTKLSRGFSDFVRAGLAEGAAPRLYGAQSAGCAPIVRLVERGDDTLVPEHPSGLARSLAIGAPADGVSAARAIRTSGGWGRAVSDDALQHGIRLLAETTGVFTETAGGVTVAAALSLARDGYLRRDDTVVLCITGNGLKTPDVFGDTLPHAPVILPRLRDAAALIASPPTTSPSTS